MTVKTNDFRKKSYYKDILEDIESLSSDLRQPNKFAQIFCEAAASQKSIDLALKKVALEILKKDEDAKKAITSIVENVDRGYWRILTGKLGYAVWTIIVIIAERLVQHFIR